MTMARTIPLWIVIYTIFHIVLEVGLGAAVWIDPSIQFGDGAAVASFPVGLYAVRSIAVGIVMAAALFAGETKILASLFLVRLITDILDLVLVFTGSPPAAMAAVSPLLLTAIYVALFYVLEILAIRRLWGIANER